jgi:hypothetical protein
MKLQYKQNAVKKFKNFSSLNLIELKKIERYYYSNLETIKNERKLISEIEIQNKTIKELIDFQKAKRAEHYQKSIQPIYDYLNEAHRFLSHHKVSFLSYKLIFGEIIEWRGKKYQSNSDVINIISEIEKQEKILKINLGNQPYSDYVKTKLINHNPSNIEKKLFRFGGVSYYVYFNTININLIEEYIKKIYDKEIDRKKILDELKAKGAKNDSETRKIAESFKRKYPLSKQLNTLKDCPYCNNYLDKNNAHLEHIYPVSKGGKSSSKNLVWVCASCNLKKKNMTLNSFIKKYEMKRMVIEINLDFLDKEY